MFANFRWQFSGGSLIIFLVLLVSPTFRYLATYLAGPESQGELDRTSTEGLRIAKGNFEAIVVRK